MYMKVQIALLLEIRGFQDRINMRSFMNLRLADVLSDLKYCISSILAL
jgi:hypothetical protein